MIIYCDIDGTLCTNTHGKGYHNAIPIFKNIELINRLYEEGHKIILWTARGTTTGRKWRKLTTFQLKIWGVLYHSLKLKKPYYDLWIDDKAVHSEDFFHDTNNKQRKAILRGKLGKTKRSR